MFGRLIKWLLTMLFIVVTGTLIGWAIPIIIIDAAPWCRVVGFMIVATVAFKIAVWAIKGEDYV